MVAALVAGALFSRQILWTPISAINMTDIVSNQFKMSGASFAGTDKNNQPFKLRATTARQEYENPDLVFMDDVSGTVNRMSDGKIITDNIVANKGVYNRTDRTITLTGRVRINSSTGDKVITNELVIKL